MPMTSKQLKNKVKNTKKSKISKNNLENTSQMLNVKSTVKSKKAKRNFESLAEDENDDEEIYCNSSGIESDEDDLREEIQNSLIYQKIQKLMAKAPELNYNFKNSDITSLQDADNSIAEDITLGSSEVGFNAESSDPSDHDSSLEGEEKDSKVLESRLQNYSRDGSKIASVGNRRVIIRGDAFRCKTQFILLVLSSALGGIRALPRKSESEKKRERKHGVAFVEN
ncbi:hypothetical protein TNCV_4912521 [Trichonephila clavipes]|nr:hypothetical protein TNCV_4912521 [Trichonephila clavipes]